MKKRKIAYVTGTRAEYGLMKDVLKKIKNDDSLSLSLVVTGSHLMGSRGSTINQIKRDGFEIGGIASLNLKGDSVYSMALAFGFACVGIAKALGKLMPDIVILVGDRTETLAAACVCAHMNIAIAHVAGGDVTGTALDDSMRHSITKLSHIHFPSNKESESRIKKLGEKPSSIFCVGAPNLEAIRKNEFTRPADAFKKFGIDKNKPLILMVQHSVTTDIENVKNQIKCTIGALKQLDLQTIAVYPNVDAGNTSIIKELQKNKNAGRIKVYKDIEREDFLGLMNIASAMVGNSSSAIIEAPSFALPAINIGTRQSNRLRGSNIIDAPYNKKMIINAIKKAVFNKKFRASLKNSKNPYGDGRTSEKIVKVLRTIKLGKDLIQKQICY